MPSVHQSLFSANILMLCRSSDGEDSEQPRCFIRRVPTWRAADVTWICRKLDAIWETEMSMRSGSGRGNEQKYEVVEGPGMNSVVIIDYWWLIIRFVLFAESLRDMSAKARFKQIQR